jgi:hypothetical protein
MISVTLAKLFDNDSYELLVLSFPSPGSRSGAVEVVDMRYDKAYLFACYNAHQRQVHRMAFAPWE